MVNCMMQKYFFHNSNMRNETVDKIKELPNKFIKKKNVVDINKLLNRVKLDEKNEIKNKIIFFSLFTLGLSAIGTFIAVIK